MKKLIAILCILVLIVLVNFVSHAETSFIKKDKINGIRYMSGGLGIEERTILKDMTKDFSTKIVFAMTKGNYISQVELIIKKINGKKIIEIVSDGPWVPVDLPEGAYEIVATHENKKKSQKVVIGKKSKTIIFQWKGKGR